MTECFYLVNGCFHQLNTCVTIHMLTFRQGRTRDRLKEKKMSAVETKQILKSGIKKRKVKKASAKPSRDAIRPARRIADAQRFPLPALEDVNPAAVADYVDQFIAYVKKYTGWDIDVDTDRVELHVADLLAIVAPALEFALQIKGSGVSIDTLEPFVLALIAAVVHRINVHAQTRFVMDEEILADLAISFRNIYNALKKDWSKIDQGEQMNSAFRLFTRCMPGCINACQKRQ